MALARVQATPKATGATAAAATFAAPPTIGNGIVAGVLISGVPATTCTDNHSNPYTLARGQVGAISSESVAIYYCAAITATGTPFTVTLGAAASAAMVAVAIEVSGVGGGLAVDSANSGNGISSTPSQNVVLVTTGEIVGAAVLAISATQGSLTVGTVDTNTPGWSQEAEELSYGPWQTGELNSRVIATPTGTLHANWTGTAVGWWAVAVVAFTATPGGPAAVESVQSFVWGPL